MPVQSMITRCVIAASLLGMPLLSKAACLDPDKTLKTIAELQEVLICLERKIDATNGTGEKIVVNYLPELEKPTISKEAYAGRVKFGLKQCERRGTDVKCDFTVRNEATDVQVTHSNNKSFAVDDFGNEYKRPQIEIGGEARAKLLINKVPVEAFVIFKGVDQASTRLTRFDLTIHTDSWHTMEFRDVALR